MSYLDEAVEAAADRIGTSPIKAVYQDAGRIARVAVKAAEPFIRKDERSKLEARLLSDGLIDRFGTDAVAAVKEAEATFGEQSLAEFEADFIAEALEKVFSRSIEAASRDALASLSEDREGDYKETVRPDDDQRLQRSRRLQDTPIWRAVTATWGSSDWSAVYVVVWFETENRGEAKAVADRLIPLHGLRAKSQPPQQQDRGEGSDG
jgi:hypothetical protein